MNSIRLSKRFREERVEQGHPYGESAINAKSLKSDQIVGLIAGELGRHAEQKHCV
ncbi:hypothetical protein OAE63_01255 [bacterium]|nr:hypothetical protein [bacterium]